MKKIILNVLLIIFILTACQSKTEMSPHNDFREKTSEEIIGFFINLLGDADDISLVNNKNNRRREPSKDRMQSLLENIDLTESEEEKGSRCLELILSKDDTLYSLFFTDTSQLVVSGSDRVFDIEYKPTYSDLRDILYYIEDNYETRPYNEEDEKIHELDMEASESKKSEDISDKEYTRIDGSLYENADELYFYDLISGDKFTSIDSDLTHDFSELLSSFKLYNKRPSESSYDGIFSYRIIKDDILTQGGAFGGDPISIRFTSRQVGSGDEELYDYDIKIEFFDLALDYLFKVL